MVIFEIIYLIDIKWFVKYLNINFKIFGNVLIFDIWCCLYLKNVNGINLFVEFLLFLSE